MKDPVACVEENLQHLPGLYSFWALVKAPVHDISEAPRSYFSLRSPRDTPNLAHGVASTVNSRDMTHDALLLNLVIGICMRCKLGELASLCRVEKHMYQMHERHVRCEPAYMTTTQPAHYAASCYSSASTAVFSIQAIYMAT